jgi:signal peptidase I
VPGLSFAAGNVVLATLGSVVVEAGAWTRWTLLGVVVATLALWTASVADAWRFPGESTSGALDRWYVYALVGLLSLTACATWALAVRRDVLEVFRVPSASMVPSIKVGAHVIVNKSAYRRGPVLRGDRVVFVNPNQRYQEFIKRVVALPGDTVDIHGDDVIINGEPLSREPSPSGSSDSRMMWERNGPASYPIWLDEAPPEFTRTSSGPSESIEVPPGRCFVLGDNRRHSIDSRAVGTIPLADIVGRVDYVF